MKLVHISIYEVTVLPTNYFTCHYSYKGCWSACLLGASTCESTLCVVRCTRPRADCSLARSALSDLRGRPTPGHFSSGVHDGWAAGSFGATILWCFRSCPHARPSRVASHVAGEARSGCQDVRPRQASSLAPGGACITAMSSLPYPCSVVVFIISREHVVLYLGWVFRYPFGLCFRWIRLNSVDFLDLRSIYRLLSVFSSTGCRFASQITGGSAFLETI